MELVAVLVLGMEYFYYCLDEIVVKGDAFFVGELRLLE